VRLINDADDKTFNERIDSYLDTDQFLRYLAVHVIIVNLDSYLCVGHNYFLYLNPTDNKFYFIPWDMNLSFAGWVWLGSREDLINLSILHPHVAENKLIERLLADDSTRQRYLRHVDDLLKTVLAPDKLEKQIDQIDRFLRPDGAPFPQQTGRDWNIKVPPIRNFPSERAKAIRAQLAGADGYRPSIRFDRIFNLPPNPALQAASKVRSPSTRPINR